MRRLLYLLPLLLFVAVAMYFGLGLNRDPQQLPSALIAQPVPEFALPPVPGVDAPGLSHRDLQGEVALVNVWASWCVPCRAEHPVLTRLAEREGVPLHGINYKDLPENAEQWLDEMGNPYRRIGADQDGRVSIDWGAYGVPETFVVDRAGRIRYRHAGAVTPELAAERLLPLIEELRRQ